MVSAVLLDYCSCPQRTENKYRVLSNFSTTTVSYVICVVLYLHSTESFTGERGLDGNYML